MYLFRKIIVIVSTINIVTIIAMMTIATIKSSGIALTSIAMRTVTIAILWCCFCCGTELCFFVSQVLIPQRRDARYGKRKRKEEGGEK